MKKHNQNTTHKYINTKKIINWSEYNKALVNRGNISLLISEDVIKDGHIVPPSKANQVGRPKEYSDELIKLALTIRTLFNLALRQTNGYMNRLH